MQEKKRHYILKFVQISFTIEIFLTGHPKIPTLLSVKKSYLPVLKLVYNQVIAIMVINISFVYIMREKGKKESRRKTQINMTRKERVRDLEKDLTHHLQATAYYIS